MWPDELKTAYDEALKAVKKAIALDPIWKEQLRLLLDTDSEKNPDEDDLEVFESYPEFRAALDLGPLTESAGKENATSNNTEAESNNDPSKNIGTSGIDPTK